MKKMFARTAGIFFVTLILLTPGISGAAIVDQWASTVISYSSQYSDSEWAVPSEWAAYQALGAPDTFDYGDIVTAWAPLPLNGTLEHITLGFTTPVYAESAVIRETYGNGFVYQIDLVDTENVFHTIWTEIDPSLPGSPVDFNVSWTSTSYLVKGIKIYVNTDHDMDAWEEIDAVKLSGTTPVPLPSAMFLFGPGLAGLAMVRRRFKK
jgi:hypothetical protein